jgi:triosephosphate isomerase (TIM)
MTARKLVAGNWKMHGTSADLGEVSAIAAAAERLSGSVDLALALPTTLIHRAVGLVPDFAIGAQDVHRNSAGAHTGDIAVGMLHDAGARFAIVGHSERRDAHREGNAEVRAKAEAALAADLQVILCVGESADERAAGKALAIVGAQVDESLPRGEAVSASSLAVAYEPIWAIGTGQVASPNDIGEMHAAIRARLIAALGDTGRRVRILYGGSVKAGNAAEIFSVADVDGALVGGASLKAADFVPIAEAAAAS